MDATGIKRIEELAAGAAPRLDSHIPAQVLPGDSSVQSLEHLQEVPARMRSTFKTERIRDFVAYLKENAGVAAAVFVAPDGGGALGVIDYGNQDAPRWGDHKAKLGMKRTPEFAAVERICEEALSQRDVIDWIEDWRDIIQPAVESGGEATEVPIARALAAIRKINLKEAIDTGHEEGDFRNRRTAMEEIEASSGGDAIPGLYKVSCRPYPETITRTVYLRLAVMTSGREPKLRFRIIGHEALKQSVAEEIELDLTARLTGIRVFIGSV